jgi:hypothetical protein
VEAAIKSLATKDDVKSIKDDFEELRMYIRKTNRNLIRWMFVFWLGQIGATLAIVLLFLKK